MGKKILYFIIIILLVIAGINAAKQITEGNEVTQTGTNITNNTNNIREENTVANNTITDTQENNNNEEKETVETAPEEEAKQIVKDNWGEDDSVYFSYDGKDADGRYVICVREIATTKALYRYYVDVETGAFDIE